MLKGLQTVGFFIVFDQIIRKLVTQIKVLYGVLETQKQISNNQREGLAFPPILYSFTSLYLLASNPAVICVYDMFAIVKQMPNYFNLVT